ncbi:1-acyl-sn-glycerol-3-phosphate acyltransferase [Corynebacterium sp. sy017]|nr:1-acyl-sn-glycerol-3-phosphate acyltransferase [Corynebacterium sp. sy017]TSD90873.1 1-acyl-sn-glycerol-3-phosphate acyltransferase [Corynebacterium sp. SY003]
MIMRESKTIYRGITEIIRGITKLQDIKLHLIGEQHIPESGGAVLAINHTGYLDFIFGGFLPRTKGRVVHYLTKASIFQKPIIGSLMQIMGHIPVDRIDGSSSFDKAVAKAKAGDLVGIFPEGTISRSFEIRSLRTGAVRIAHEAGVPVIVQIIFGSQRIWTKGHKRNMGRSHIPIMVKACPPFYPTGDVEADNAQLHQIMSDALAEVWQQYQEECGDFPAGAYWVPARLGGGAPSLEEMEQRDQAVEEERHRVRRLSEDLTRLRSKVEEATRAIFAETAEQKSRLAASSQMTWLKENLDAVLSETSRGLHEGKGRVTASVQQLRAEIASMYASLAHTSREIYEGSALEEALVNVGAYSRLIVSSLPHRVKTEFSDLPSALICDVEHTLCPTGEPVPQRTVAALTDIAERGTTLIFTSEQAPREDVRTLFPQSWYIAHNGALITHADNTDNAEVIGISAAHIEQVTALLEENKLLVSWSGVDGMILSGKVELDPVQHKDIVTKLAEMLCVTPYAKGVIVGAQGVDKASALSQVMTMAARQKQPCAAEDAVLFAGTQSDLVLMSQVGTCVALYGSAPSVVQRASSLTSARDDEGVANIVELILKNNQDTA